MALAQSEPSIPEWTLADRLVKAREYASLSREQMAEAMATTVKNIWNWEHGVRPRTDLVDFAQRWAEITNVPVSWLLGLDGSTTWFAPEPSLVAVPVSPGQTSLHFEPPPRLVGLPLRVTS